MLKTSYISAGARRRARRSLEHGRRRQRGVDREARCAVEAQQVQHPPPVMWASPRTGIAERSRSSAART